MIKTLQRRFIATAMLSIGLVLFVLMVAINTANYFSVEKTISQRLSLISDGFEKHFNDFPEPHDKTPPHKGGSAEAEFDTRYFTVKLREDGSVYTVNTGRISAISTTDAQEYATILYELGKTSGYYGNYRYICETDVQGYITYTFLDVEREFTAFRNFLWVSIAVSALGLFFVYLLVIFFSKKLVSPIAESYEIQKRFITDASHELKTPLTIIDANIEVLEMEHGVSQWTQSTHKQVERLGNLTEKMVFLARMDEQSTKPALQEFCISDALWDTVDNFSTLSKSSEKPFNLQITEDIHYYGDEGMLRQAFSLLIENALKYATPSTPIRISLTTEGKHIVLAFSNEAASLPTGSLNVLFERFYRMDASRNSSTGGYGIGLSVVQAIIQAHKGKITAKSQDGHSIQFTIML